MPVTPFVRSPNLSSTLVLERMQVKRAIYAKRREAIKRQSEKLVSRLTGCSSSGAVDLQARIRSLDAEDRMIAGFQADLEALARMEEDGVARRSGRAGSVIHDVGKASGSPSSTVSPSCLAAGGGSDVARYDEALCLFKASSASIVGDSSAKPLDDVAEGDALLLRAISLLDVPGLAHMALLTERRQEVLVISSDGVLSEAIGLPAAEAFAMHLFSADAYASVLDEATGVKFVSDVVRSPLKRST